jgi:glutamate-5-semialdehyde dehydrogenase
VGKVDLIIPRGGHGLISHVSKESLVPVIKHDAGNCHTYIEASADVDKALAILENAKTQRTGVCNATESLVIDAAIASTFLPKMETMLKDKHVELRGCEKTCAILPNITPATESDWGEEYLDLILSIKVVENFDEAVTHISTYSSGHTEAIVTSNISLARAFEEQIDSSVVMINASTRFSDGGMFGLGAEIGISTDRLHARGPMGAASLTTYKYVLKGDGQIRN